MGLPLSDSRLMAKIIKISIFFLGTFPYDYDYMCSETDFSPENSFSSNYKNPHFFLLLLAATVSQNGQIVV